MFGEELMRTFDYQIKSEELAKEIMFLQQYGDVSLLREEKQTKTWDNKEENMESEERI